MADAAFSEMQLEITVQPPGFASDPHPVLIAHGVTVFAGINNVGKSRWLDAVQQVARWWNQLWRLQDLWPAHVAVTTKETKAEWTIHDPASGCICEVTRRAPGQPDYIRRLLLSPEEEQIKLLNESNQVIPPWLGTPSAGSYHSGGFRWVCDGNVPEMTDALARVIRVPPHRNVHATRPVNMDKVPNPTGENLPSVVHYWQSKGDSRVAELTEVMGQLFPEIDQIITPVWEACQCRLEVKDRYIGEHIPFDQCGTGVQEMLQLAALVLFSEPGRIFLIDEPDLHLHASAERFLADFLRRHPEHAYVIVTHAPVLIDALNPDQIYHVTRDKAGTHIHAVFSSDNGEQMSSVTRHAQRERVFADLGWRPSQFAWADRVLFVEGESDADVWQKWFECNKWVPPKVRCVVLPLGGSGTTKPLKTVIEDLVEVLSIPLLILLDGDKRHEKTLRGERVRFLPEPDLESVLIRSPNAVWDAFVTHNPTLDAETCQQIASNWSAERVRNWLQQEKAANKGAKCLTDLAKEMGLTYRKRRDAPRIASCMPEEDIKDILQLVEPFVVRGELPPPDPESDRTPS